MIQRDTDDAINSFSNTAGVIKSTHHLKKRRKCIFSGEISNRMYTVNIMEVVNDIRLFSHHAKGPELTSRWHLMGRNGTFKAHSAINPSGASSRLCLAVAEESPIGHVFVAGCRKLTHRWSWLYTCSACSQAALEHPPICIQLEATNTVFIFAGFTSVWILYCRWFNQGFADLVKDGESSRIIVRGVTVGWFLPPPCILTVVLFFSFIMRIMQQYYTELSMDCKAEGVQYCVRLACIWKRRSGQDFGHAVITHNCL